jgi:hypothetical protein
MYPYNVNNQIDIAAHSIHPQQELKWYSAPQGGHCMLVSETNANGEFLYAAPVQQLPSFVLSDKQELTISCTNFELQKIDLKPSELNTRITYQAKAIPEDIILEIERLDKNQKQSVIHSMALMKDMPMQFAYYEDAKQARVMYRLIIRSANNRKMRYALV